MTTESYCYDYDRKLEEYTKNEIKNQFLPNVINYYWMNDEFNVTFDYCEKEIE